MTARRLILSILFTVSVSMVFAVAASAMQPGPGWELTERTYPTYLPPNGTGTIGINVFNIGAGASHGRLTLTDTLPEGVTAVEAGVLASPTSNFGYPVPEIHHRLWDCSGNGPEGSVDGATVVTCANEGPASFEGFTEFAGGGGVPWGSVAPEGRDVQPRVGILVKTGAAASGLTNRATIAGGGAPEPASTEDPVTVSSAKAPFSVVGVDGWLSNEDGTIDTQAGSHPYEFGFTFAMASTIGQGGEELLPSGSLRNVEVQLPPGFVGNPTAVPECTREQLTTGVLYKGGCPQASEVGFDETYFPELEVGFPVFNMVPPRGAAAEFGFDFEGILVYLDFSVRTGGDYGITVHSNQTPQRLILENTMILWDVPGDHSHNDWRVGVGTGGPCSQEQIESTKGTTNNEDLCLEPQLPLENPFLTLPTSCGAPQPFSIRVNSWQDESDFSEAKFLTRSSSGIPTGFTGCENDGFAPLISTSPDTARSDTPAGLTVDVKPPVGGLSDQNGSSTSDIQDTKVTLPAGFVINPGQAAGLQACQPGDVEGGDDLPLPGENGEEERFAGPAQCPNASKVGTVTIASPLIEGAADKQFEGNVYVLQSNPPELKLLVAASADGVNLKLVGVVHLNEQTGQITTTFDGTPALPFTDFKLSFSGGAQAALDTPTQCGTYEATATFTPWGSPFIEDFPTSADFALSEGPGGSSCPSSPLPFAPVLTAGSTTDQAGASTGFTMLLSRGDAQQRIEKLQFKIPPGLSGIISSVPLCGEPQASQGTCPASSHVGHTVVTSGPGPYPLVIPQPGNPEAAIYLTGPYKGAPFGLSIVTPVIAGPFNLGTIVTRAAIEVDPRTAQITVTTDPLPQVVDGVPTDLRSVDAVIDRPGFMINPTNCESSSFSGTAWGTPPPGAGGPGSTAAISSHFGVGSCRSLQFKPKFTTATKARASKANGASLSFKISYPKGAMGSDAWFNEAQFDIPRQLPARLSTLQQSCLAATFETNRAACPKASVIGHAVVHTPVLPVPLEGSVYFVSYGSAKFPDAVLDLHGDNVHVELHGETFISKTSVTSATFRNTPDVPFESIEVTVPMGTYSEFGANLPAKDNYDFCGQKLKMPTFFKAQNGLEIHQETPVTVSGCPKAKKAKTAAKKHTKTTSHKKASWSSRSRGSRKPAST
jgi:hypothetical protein